MLEKGIICFYDRVIVQQGEKYTFLHNPNVLMEKYIHAHLL